jgi:hypothetical protein
VCQGRVQAFLYKPLAGPKDRVGAGVQCLGDPVVIPSVAGLGNVGLQQDARLEQIPCRMLACDDQPVQPIALIIAQPDDILPGGLFPCHESAPSLPGHRFEV